VSLLLAACGWFDDSTPPIRSAPEVVARPTGPPDAPRRGVGEVDTPPEFVRATAVKDEAAAPVLDVWWDPDHATGAELRAELERWSFVVLDGDGESWRVRAPTWSDWAARLEPLPEVARVTAALHQDPLPSGAFREGGETYGPVQRTFAFRPGGPVRTVVGGVEPPAPELPRGLSTALVRCLSPLRTDMRDGLGAGPGWERAYVASANAGGPSAWGLVLDHFGACDVSGAILMLTDAPTAGLRAPGSEREILESAAHYLRTPRPRSDDQAHAALDLLRNAPDDILRSALDGAAPGWAQAELLEAAAPADEAGAIAFAGKSASPTLLAWAASQDEQVRARVLADERAPAEARRAAVLAWRPAEGDTLGDRLRADPDATVRMRAWEATGRARLAGCSRRDTSDPASLWRDCPINAVRRKAFDALAAQDKAAAAELLKPSLENPETVVLGVLAARLAAALERDDLLEALIARDTVPREPRATALKLLQAGGRSANAASLAQAHGDYLGVEAEPAKVARP
jgi:hypothetical protein